MIVVSNTSPLNYLTLIKETDLLPKLFERVVIPQAVLDELRHPGSPVALKHWIEVVPTWLEVRTIAPMQLSRTVGSGETEVISLAVQLNAELVLLDDNKARKTALDHGLNVAGVLNVLALASARQLVDLPTAIIRLLQTNFRASAAIIKTILERDKVRGK